MTSLSQREREREREEREREREREREQCLSDSAELKAARAAQCINQTGRVFSIGDLITVAVKTSGKGRVSAGSVRDLS